MNPWQQIADHYEALERLFRGLKRPESAEYYAGMARIYRARAEEA